MTNLKYVEAKDLFINQLREFLQDDLLAIISIGSETNGELIDGWSDLDFLIVVNKMALNIKSKIAETISTVENSTGIHFGINIISREEATHPLLPTINLEGKTLQTLLELSRDPSRLLISKIPKDDFYAPADKDVKEYSLSNIKMLVRRNRISLSRRPLEDLDELKKIAAKEVSAAFIITKLAIQYLTSETVISNKTLLQRARESFKDFDFTTLETNQQYINKWDYALQNKETLMNILSDTNDFIESFSNYVYKKASK